MYLHIRYKTLHDNTPHTKSNRGNRHSRHKSLPRPLKRHIRLTGVFGFHHVKRMTQATSDHCATDCACQVLIGSIKLVIFLCQVIRQYDRSTHDSVATSVGPRYLHCLLERWSRGDTVDASYFHPIHRNINQGLHPRYKECFAYDVFCRTVVQSPPECCTDR